jgi:uncharacterized protein involved in response to NO
MQIEDPKAAAGDRSFALWRLGFRPFYLLAAALAALAVPLWALRYAGLLEGAAWVGPDWHAHEMLFGFTVAVIAGFLMTAVRNWTNRPTPTGAWLAALAVLWVAGRVLMLSPWPAAAAVVNVAFPLAVAVAIGIPLVRSGNRRNYFFVALLVALAIVVGSTHAARLGWIVRPGLPRLGVALDMVLFIMAVMGGRVIPMFTNNGVPGTAARRHPLLEKLALGTVLALLAADLLQLPAPVTAPLAALAAAAHGARLGLWQPWRTVRVPLVWVLHAGYAWIPVHLALRALGDAGWIATPLATHALTIGAIGGLTIGMMTRTARGHTGRLLLADRFETTAYACVLAAAVVRVFGGLLLPSLYVPGVVASAMLWSAGYAIYAVRYWPVLTRPRIDGRPG